MNFVKSTSAGRKAAWTRFRVIQPGSVLLLISLCTLAGCNDPVDVPAGEAEAGTQEKVVDDTRVKTVPASRQDEAQPRRSHPDAVPNTHAVGEVDKPELVPFIVTDPAKLPGIVVDENQATLVGKWQYSTHTPPYVGIGYLHDQKADKGTKSVTFTPELPHAGLYEVRVSHCYNIRRALNTPVLIHHADGETTVRINQQEVPKFKRLFRAIGRFRFEAGKQGWVRISTDGTDGKYVIADAVQFIPVR